MNKNNFSKALRNAAYYCSFLSLDYPDPVPVRRVKAMIEGLLALQLDIVELGDYENCSTLMLEVTACLDDLVEGINLQRRASEKFEQLLKTFAQKKKALGR
jgi:hypothetical protein